MTLTGQKRIELLAELTWQAATDADSEFQPTGEFLRKFAETVILECAGICDANADTYSYSFTPAKARLAESTSRHCASLIKKHFGIEE